MLGCCHNGTGPSRRVSVASINDSWKWVTFGFELHAERTPEVYLEARMGEIVLQHLSNLGLDVGFATRETRPGSGAGKLLSSQGLIWLFWENTSYCAIIRRIAALARGI